jgi:catechol 2,3-dioxygenase-like lactoylglutathione lyase family enzyme
VNGVLARLLDHVALWVADREAAAERLLELTGVHVVERNERFTLLGADARRGKLTFFEAEGPREPGALRHVALRVSSGEEAEHDLGEGVTLQIVQAATDVEWDLDSVGLFSRDPERIAREYLGLGFAEAPPRDGAPRVQVGGAFVEFHEGDVPETERPLLNHIGVLSDRADDAKELGVEVADVVDAPNTYAVFVWGPERVKIEYVEHKSTFSLV